MKRFILLLLCCSPALIYSQKVPLKWGKVPDEDLQMTVYPLDTAAEAVILEDYAELVFDLSDGDPKYRFEHHRRIKILKRSGFDQADVSIPFYRKGRLEEVRSLKAQIFAPDGSSQEVDKKDVFEEEIDERWSAHKFTFPNVQIGSVIEYRYQLISTSILDLREWYFQSTIPVRWSELRMEIPEWYHYVTLNQGRELDIQESDVQLALITIPNYVPGYLPGNDDYQQKGLERIQANVRKARFVMKEVPAMHPEAYITTIKDYLARIRFQLQAVQFPRSGYQPVMSSWEEVAKDLLEDNQFGEQFLKGRHFDKPWAAVNPLIKDLSSDADKMKAIYEFVCRELKWDGTYTYWVRDSDLDECYEKRSASSGEINLLLLGLLKEAGISAHPALISTRDHGKMIQIYPILDQFNHVLVVAEIDGAPWLLDAVDAAFPPGYPTENSLNHFGWLIYDGQPQWIEISPPDGEQVVFAQLKLSDDGRLSGTVNSQHKGYLVLTERSSLQEEEPKTVWKKRLEDQYPDLEMTEVNVEGVEEFGQPVKGKLSCDLPSAAAVAGDLIYLPPTVHALFSDSPFDVESRDYPVDIPFPLKEQYILNVELPDGFAVEEVPESASYELPEHGATFKYSVNDRGGSVQIICKIEISQLHFEPEEYAGLKNFFDIMMEKRAEPVVLKRKS